MQRGVMLVSGPSRGTVMHLVGRRPTITKRGDKWEWMLGRCGFASAEDAAEDFDWLIRCAEQRGYDRARQKLLDALP